jgi:hypothetical protein
LCYETEVNVINLVEKLRPQGHKSLRKGQKEGWGRNTFLAFVWSLLQRKTRSG